MGSVLLLLAFGFVNPQQQANVNAYFLWQNAMQHSGQPVYAANLYNNPETEIAVREARYRYWQTQIAIQEAVAQQWMTAYTRAEETYNEDPSVQNYNNMMEAHETMTRQYEAYQHLIDRAKLELQPP